jgi:hypothetical protein
MSYTDKSSIRSNSKSEVFKELGIKEAPRGDPKRRPAGGGQGGKIEKTGNDVMVHKNER